MQAWAEQPTHIPFHRPVRLVLTRLRTHRSLTTQAANMRPPLPLATAAEEMAGTRMKSRYPPPRQRTG